MDKEKVTRDVVLRVQPSLFEKFRQRCQNNYKTISEVLREFMVKYVQEDK